MNEMSKKGELMNELMPYEIYIRVILYAYKKDTTASKKKKNLLMSTSASTKTQHNLLKISTEYKQHKV
jgi:hypothetical protein